MREERENPTKNPPNQQIKNLSKLITKEKNKTRKTLKNK